MLRNERITTNDVDGNSVLRFVARDLELCCEQEISHQLNYSGVRSLQGEVSIDNENAKSTELFLRRRVFFLNNLTS